MPEPRPPQQNRSERTQERLLRAAEKLILEKGLGDASVPEIARRAGSSVGGFYARFPDKDALLRALEERFFAEMLGRVAKLADAGRWGAAPIATIVRACADELVSVFRERRNLIAAFLHRATRDPQMLADALRFRAQTAERIAALLLPRRHELGHPDPRLAIDLGVQFAFALMLQLAAVGELRAAGRVLSDRELQAEIERNFLAYLGAPPPEGDPP
jgi:AcrR family transcriptional regulator